MHITYVDSHLYKTWHTPTYVVPDSDVLWLCVFVAGTFEGMCKQMCFNKGPIIQCVDEFVSFVSGMGLHKKGIGGASHEEGLYMTVGVIN